MAVPEHPSESSYLIVRDERDDALAKVERLRAEVMRQWAETHYWLCRCDGPDSAACDWPVPIKHTMPELREAVASCQGENAR